MIQEHLSQLASLRLDPLDIQYDTLYLVVVLPGIFIVRIIIAIVITLKAVGMYHY